MKKILLIGATLALLGAGCAANQTPAAPGVQAPTPSRKKITCETLAQEGKKDVDYWLNRQDGKAESMDKIIKGLTYYRPNTQEGLPAGFPPPPPSTKLCGEFPNVGVVYFETALSLKDIVDYYEPLIVAHGYTPFKADIAAEAGYQKVSGKTADAYYSDKVGAEERKYIHDINITTRRGFVVISVYNTDLWR